MVLSGLKGCEQKQNGGDISWEGDAVPKMGRRAGGIVGVERLL